MTNYLAAVALAAAVAQPAAAITFPALTTIYIGSGVRDNGGGDNQGTVTVVRCSNVSGVTATIRFLVLTNTGAVAATHAAPINHGATYEVATKFAFGYIEDVSLATGAVTHGVLNIESTQSGVFCNGVVVNAGSIEPVGVPLPLVRGNPHPGTVE